MAWNDTSYNGRSLCAVPSSTRSPRVFLASSSYSSEREWWVNENKIDENELNETME